MLSKYDMMTVGETAGVTIEEAQKYAGDEREELNMVFQFEHVDIGRRRLWQVDRQNGRLQQSSSKIMIKWQKELEGKAWNSLFLG